MFQPDAMYGLGLGACTTAQPVNSLNRALQVDVHMGSGY